MRKQDWLIGLLHSAVWIGAIALFPLAMKGNSAAAAYAATCAWWATLYVALLLGTGWRAAVAFLLIMTAVFSVDASAGWNFLYHDAPGVLSVQFVFLVAVLAIVWMSPFVLNVIVKWAYKHVVAVLR